MSRAERVPVAGSGPGPASSGVSRRRRLTRIAFFVLAQVALVSILLEIAARAFDPLGISYYPETAAFFDRLIREEGIGYRMPAGLRGRFWGASVTTSSLGIRDREIAPVAAPGEFRLLVLGDSWPFGLGVADDETIPRRLEEMLNERSGGSPRFRTINLGVPSYNTEQELIQLREIGLALDPDLVVLFYAMNDIETKTWVLDKRANVVANLAQRSYAASLLTILSRRARATFGAPAEPALLPGYAPDDPRWQAMSRAMLGIARACRERGIPFVVVGKELAERALPMLRELGRDGEFPVVNLLPAADSRWVDVPPLELQNSAVDSHPNARGTVVDATLVLEALERLALLPPR